MRKILFCTLIIIMFFPFTAFAAELDENETNKVESEEELIQPRYTYISFISVSLKIDENGFVEYNCSTGSLKRNVRMKLYLQRSKNQFLWEDIIGTIKTEYESGRISETFNLPANDYFYRAKVVVEVLDDNKNIIESETAYSSTERY